jgi:hypothetical protein
MPIPKAYFLFSQKKLQELHDEAMKISLLSKVKSIFTNQKKIEINAN